MEIVIQTFVTEPRQEVGSAQRQYMEGRTAPNFLVSPMIKRAECAKLFTALLMASGLHGEPGLNVIKKQGSQTERGRASNQNTEAMTVWEMKRKEKTVQLTAIVR